MLIDQTNKQFLISDINHTTEANIFVSANGMISFEMDFNYQDIPYKITLSDELINFLPVFFFPMENENWECIIMINYLLYDSFEFDQLKVNPVIKNGELKIYFQDLIICFDLTKLMFSRNVLGESIYGSLIRQAKYLENL